VKKILIIQTAFLGDLILTLPLIQIAKKHMPEYTADIVVIPSTSEILKNNPLFSNVIVYDKRNSGLGEMYKFSKQLKKSKYDILISPHRSGRSAMLNFLASPKTSIGFDKSSIGFLYDHTVKYETGLHEIQRNLRLLEPLGIHKVEIVRPELFIGESEKSFVDGAMTELRLSGDKKFVTIAPGSVWFTKRFPESKFAELCKMLATEGIRTVLIGGKSDIDTGMRIMNEAKSELVSDLTGKLTILQSAELIKRSSLLVTNDSAPLHIGNAVETLVFAIFGSTITGFGFYPYGKSDLVFQTNDLACRPCGIHGRTSCPIGTLECMKRIDVRIIAEHIAELFRKA
jgi:heptosyltransferase-2